MAEPRLALIEPWFGESHAAFINGLAENLDLPCELITLRATKWKWRMRMSAWILAAKIAKIDPWPDVMLVSDYVNLPSLIGFCPRIASTHTAVYFHENQLTYPLRKGTRRDFEFCAINVLTCLAATRCIFCSRQQMEAFIDGIPAFLRHDETIDSAEIVAAIETKSVVIPVGVNMKIFDDARNRSPNRSGEPLRVIWPHRFEHDKNPDDFFSVLFDLAHENLPFEVSVIGRSNRDTPPIMDEARERLGDRIVEWGFLEGMDYANALAESDVVVSTAWQETLGLAVIEAISAGCDPLLPDRLSYPEVLGKDLCEKHLYQNKGELRRRLRWMMRNPDRVRATSNHHAEMERFSWKVVAPMFEKMVRELAAN